MPKRRSTSKNETNVRVGNISRVSGKVNIAGGNVTTHETKPGLSGAEIEALFDKLYSAIEAKTASSPANKEDLKAEVEEIQTAVTDAVKKNEQVDEGFLARRFRNIARMTPDVLDVIVATLASPLAGLGVAFGKIAKKAKEDA